MKEITLVQAIADFNTYQEMIQRKELPLVLELTKDEMEVVKSSLGANSDFYFNIRVGTNNDKNHLFLSAIRLREAIESEEIYISRFIDLNGNTKYVDYIRESHSVDCSDIIVFRKKKRLFKKSQAKYSLQKSQVKSEMIRCSIENVSGYVSAFIATEENSDKEELFTLCTSLLYHYSNNNTPKQKVKV